MAERILGTSRGRRRPPPSTSRVRNAVGGRGRVLCSTVRGSGDRAGPPGRADRRWIHDAYLGELVRRVVLDSTRDRLLSILTELQTTAGVDGLILGGTELSLILTEPVYEGVPVLNAAAIHVAEAVGWLRGGEAPGPNG